MRPNDGILKRLQGENEWYSDIFLPHFSLWRKSESLEASPWLGPLVSVRVNVQARLVDPPAFVFYFVFVYLYLCIFVILGVLVQVIIETWLALVDQPAWKSFFSVETKLLLCFCPCYVVMKYLYSSVKLSLLVLSVSQSYQTGSASCNIELLVIDQHLKFLLLTQSCLRFVLLVLFSNSCG